MAEIEISSSEREQLRRLLILKNILLVIFFKWIWALAFVFVVVLAICACFLIDRSANSIKRFSSAVRLVYSPRSTATASAINEKQLMGILNRPSLKRRVGSVINLSNLELQCLVSDLSISQDRKQTSFLTLTANASTRRGADKKAHAYAEVVVAEYAEYRSRDLRKRYDTLETRKRKLQEKVTSLDAEEKVLKSKTGMVSPVETLTLLNGLISDQRRNLSLLNVQIANEEVKKKQVEAMVGKLGDVVAKCGPMIRQKSTELAAIDAELARLRDVYTDLNPKVLGKLEDRKVVIGEYLKLLKDNGLADVGLADLEQTEKAVRNLAEINQRLDVLFESRHSIEGEIKVNEQKCLSLTTIIPELERISSGRMAIERNIHELNVQQDDLEYLILTASSDLQAIDDVEGAGQLSPFRARNLLLPFLAALFCSFALFFWIALGEFFFGKVHGTNELLAYDDVMVLGALPKPKAMPEEMESNVHEVVALNFCRAEVPKGIVLVCRLTSKHWVESFMTTLEWSLSLAGQRTFVLDVVSVSTFEPPDGSETMMNVVRKDSHGWFPAANRYVLLPAESQMLKVDLETLRKDFDNVFVVIPEGMKQGGSFFNQLLDLCESALLVVRAGSTPRANFRFVHRCVADSGKKMMGIVAGVSRREVNRVMEK